MIHRKDLLTRVWEHVNQITPFSKEEFELMASFASPFELKRGILVYRQGSIPAYGGFILKGSMRYVYQHKEDRKETTVGFQFEDTCFGDLRSIFFREPAATSLQTMEDTMIGRLDKEHYLYLLENCKPFAKLMILSMEKKYNDLIDESIENKIQEAEDRYLKLLSAYPHILQRVSQRHIASYLGIKPQSLSRIRKSIMTRHIVRHAA
jgi:CRP-like cAMP-binding protein